MESASRYRAKNVTENYSFFPFAAIFPISVSNSLSDWVRIGGRELEIDDVCAMHCLQTPFAKCNKFEAAAPTRRSLAAIITVKTGPSSRNSAEPELAFDAAVFDALYRFPEVELAPVAGFAGYTYALARFLLCL